MKYFPEFPIAPKVPLGTHTFCAGGVGEVVVFPPLDPVVVDPLDPLVLAAGGVAVGVWVVGVCGSVCSSAGASSGVWVFAVSSFAFTLTVSS